MREQLAEGLSIAEVNGDEKLRPVNGATATEDLDADSELLQYTNFEKACEDLFVLVDEYDGRTDADDEGEPFEGPFDDFGEEYPYALRVEGTLIDEALHPKLISIDVYKGHEHTQRVSLTALWEGEEPNIDDVKSSSLNSDYYQYSLPEIIAHARGVVMVAGGNRMVFPIPDTTLKQIH